MIKTALAQKNLMLKRLLSSPLFCVLSKIFHSHSSIYLSIIYLIFCFTQTQHATYHVLQPVIFTEFILLSPFIIKSICLLFYSHGVFFCVEIIYFMYLIPHSWTLRLFPGLVITMMLHQHTEGFLLVAPVWVNLKNKFCDKEGPSHSVGTSV